MSRRKPNGWSESHFSRQHRTKAATVLTPILLLASACIGSPTGLEDQQALNRDPFSVAPATVWLWPGNSRELKASLAEKPADGDTVTFSWSSSNPGVVEVDQNGVLHANGPGAARINVAASGTGIGEVHRDGAVTVTVMSDEREAGLATIFSVPRLDSVWSRLPFTSRYDELFERYGDKHYERSAGVWEQTYYDRGFAWYAAWWRSGEAGYVDRGNTDVLAYRDDYVLKNNGEVPPRWVFPEGLAVHYLMTDDARSLEAITKMADRMEYVGWLDNMMETKYRDGRIQGRAILVQIIAYVLTGDDVYRARARRGIDGLAEWYESSGSNGSWDHPTRSDVSYCGGMATFQIAHAILDAMIRYHDLIEPDPRILPMVTESLDYSWDLWVPGEGFPYVQPPDRFLGDRFVCPSDGSSDPAKDVNLLIATSFGEAYRLTGAERFRTRGDEVVELGLNGSIFMDGYKQFNQSFMRSYRYPFYTN